MNYPDPDTKMLRQRISEHYDIDPDTILCGNGSTELIYLIPRALKPEQILIPSPTFSEYERACRLSRGEAATRPYELKEENEFRLHVDSFISAMQGCEMAFLCNPNNPTGTLLSREEVLEIAVAAKRERCLLVVDEAFIDFTPGESVMNDVKDNSYLIVLRSMTKFHALTGLRIGFAVFHRDLIGRVLDFKEPWTVNNLAQKAAVTALEDVEYADRTFELMKKEKEFIENGLRRIGINYYPSSANYYLINVGARRVVPLLRQKGILVRDCSNFRGLSNSYIRIAVKSRKHNSILMKELSELCAG